MDVELLAIGDVERATGVRATTLRSWERHGLVVPRKTEGGRRLYATDDLARIAAVERMRRVQGLNLRAIRAALAPPTAAANAPAMPPSEVGARVRARRLGQGLSVRALAARGGLAASFVSTLERGAANPSASSLSRLAAALGTTMADLLGRAAADPSGLVPAGTGRRLGLGPLVEVEQVTVGEALMDAEVWTLAPGAESDGAYVHQGEELMHVLEGRIEIGLDAGPPRAALAGDSLYFASDRPHRWRNPGPEPARVLWVNTDKARLEDGRPPRRSGPAFAFPEIREGFAESYRVVDTHTAGHPTRVLVDGCPDLAGATARAKREDFVRRFDGLRGKLLHEPRGHAATFGVVLTSSTRADFGAVFVGSYKYPDMCGHGTIGLARALRATGRLGGRSAFTLETPAGVVEVRLGPGDPRDVTLRNVPSRLLHRGVRVDLQGSALSVDVAYGGMTYALVPSAALDLRVTPDRVGQALAAGAALRAAVNAALEAAGEPGSVESVLFHEDAGPATARHLVVLEGGKFDRSPCGTGTSARLAQLHALGRLGLGETLAVEGVAGGRFAARVVAVTDRGIVPEITGRAHVTGLSVLVAEEDDPLAGGFLCR